jgi:hypothetical protein
MIVCLMGRDPLADDSGAHTSKQVVLLSTADDICSGPSSPLLLFTEKQR